MIPFHFRRATPVLRKHLRCNALVIRREVMKLAFASFITIIASFVLLFAVALAQPATSQGEGESHRASDQAPPSSGKSSGTAGTGMMGQGMGGPGMMGGPHMMIEPNGV